MNNDFTTTCISSYKIEFDVEVVHKITEDALHKIYKEATIPVVS